MSKPKNKPRWILFLVAPIVLLPHSLMIANTLLFSAMAPWTKVVIDYEVTLLILLSINATLALFPLFHLNQFYSYRYCLIFVTLQTASAGTQFVIVLWEVDQLGFNSTASMFVSGFSGAIAYPAYEFWFIAYLIGGYSPLLTPKNRRG